MADIELNRMRNGKRKQAQAPVAEKVAALRWVRENFFSTIGNTILTVIIGVFIIKFIPPFIQWAFADAVWGAQTHEVCRASEGACWAVITEKHRPMLFGLYPYEEHWRLVVAPIVYVGAICITLTRRFWHVKILVPLWIANLATCLLMWGGILGLTFVETSAMGWFAADHGAVYGHCGIRHAHRGFACARKAFASAGYQSSMCCGH